VAKCEDLAIDRVHGVQRVLHPDLELGSESSTRGRGQPAQQHGGQGDRAGLGQRAVTKGNLQPDVPGLAAEVFSVQGHEPLIRDPAQPEEHRHRGACQVVPAPPGNVKVRLLQHVRRVEPPLEPAIQPQLHHPLQPVAMARKQLQQRGLVPALDSLEQLGRFVGFQHHDQAHS
jgi:hypothetical protein